MSDFESFLERRLFQNFVLIAMRMINPGTNIWSGGCGNALALFCVKIARHGFNPTNVLLGTNELTVGSG